MTFNVLDKPAKWLPFANAWLATCARVACAAVGITLAADHAVSGPRLTRVYPLRTGEIVNAYARISPSGRFLAYASDVRRASNTPATMQKAVNVVDFQEQRIVFTETGVDAYWSPDEKRLIYLSMRDPDPARATVAIRHQQSGIVARDVAPAGLGDYFSWGVRDGKDVIVTIKGHYYYLSGDRASLPYGSVPSCPDVGFGERPLVSKDGRRITTFVNGTIVVRNLTDCKDIIYTGVQGAKADFSWDGRYIAFHAPKPKGTGFEIRVIDTQERTIRTITDLAGWSFFPSWTQDGRLCFRYIGDDYRGFIMAADVLSARARPLPQPTISRRPRLAWADVFPETRVPSNTFTMVMIWAPWSAHSPQALVDLQAASRYFKAMGQNVEVVTALHSGSLPSDVEETKRANLITLLEIPLSPERLLLTDAVNQNPTTLLFCEGDQIDRRLGPQTLAELLSWVTNAQRGAASPHGCGTLTAKTMAGVLEVDSFDPPPIDGRQLSLPWLR